MYLYACAWVFFFYNVASELKWRGVGRIVKFYSLGQFSMSIWAVHARKSASPSRQNSMSYGKTFSHTGSTSIDRIRTLFPGGIGKKKKIVIKKNYGETLIPLSVRTWAEILLRPQFETAKESQGLLKDCTFEHSFDPWVTKNIVQP